MQETVHWGSPRFKAYLSPQIRDGDELLEDILRQDVRVAILLDVVRADINVVRSEVQIGRRDGSHTPLRLAAKVLLLVVGRGGGDDLLTVLIHRLCRSGGELGLVFRRLLNFGNLLALL